VCAIAQEEQLRRLAPFLICFVLMLNIATAQTPRLTVFAAASLGDAMRAIDQAWMAQGHQELRLSFAASSTLARQLDHGAPANLFASADEAWMDWATERNLIDAASRRDVLSNELVLIVPKEHAEQIDIKPGFDLAGLLGRTGRLAMGDPAHVPAGRYAKQALTNLGAWDLVSKRLAPAENVRSALLLVERGEAPAGIVYATDAAASRQVTIAGVFPPDSHDPIKYPFAITRVGNNPDAHLLLDFISSSDARSIFARFGFTVK
jgi:molybdate transport system substrate-binding protein